MAFCSESVARTSGPTDERLFHCCPTGLSVRCSVGLPPAPTTPPAAAAAVAAAAAAAGSGACGAAARPAVPPCAACGGADTPLDQLLGTSLWDLCVTEEVGGAVAPAVDAAHA